MWCCRRFAFSEVPVTPSDCTTGPTQSVCHFRERAEPQSEQNARSIIRLLIGRAERRSARLAPVLPTGSSKGWRAGQEWCNK